MASLVTPFTFSGPAGRLEALWKGPEGELRGSAVVAHAHPLHGGTMHFKAVFRIARALARAGYGVLRFNFRGVGASEGRHDGGRGERDDFRAALDEAEARGGAPLLAAGFSFGATVALSVGASDARVVALVGAGVPLTRWSFADMPRTEKPALLVSGGDDEFLVPGGLQGAAGTLPDAKFEILPGADHFFAGRLDWLESRVLEFASGVAAGAGA
jgi:alpha/beta superfamily hydrolase